MQFFSLIYVFYLFNLRFFYGCIILNTTQDIGVGSMNSKIFTFKNKMLNLFFGLILVMCAYTVPVAHADIGDRLEVFKSNKMLYVGPSSTASRLLTLKVGEQMVEMERQGAWVFVALKSSGAQGWVRSSVVRKAPRKVIRAQKRVLHSKKVAAAKKTKAKRVPKARNILKPVPEAAAVESELPHVTRRVSLEDMGFKEGVLFEGATVTHSNTFFFPAPLDSQITNGTLRLLFRASPGLNPFANIRVAVNNIPYQQVNIPDDVAIHQMDVLLPSSAFKEGLVKVDVRATLPVTKNRCFDARLNDIFLHILPQTSLAYSYQPVGTSIRDAWRMLPQRVTLSLSKGALSKGQFASTLAVMSMLMDNGKEVKITRLPEIGDIIVAPKLAIERMMDQKLLKNDKGGIAKGMSGALDHVSNLALVRFANRSVIVLTDPYDVQPMYLLDDTWKMLAAGDRYRAFRPDNLNAHSQLPSTGDKEGYYSLPLSKLGLDTTAKFLTREVSWHTVISPYSLPLGTQPDFLNINIVAPVYWKEDPSYEMYVFLNGVLVKSARLKNTGLKQQFTVNMPSEYQKQFNDIRVVVQHDIKAGDCEGVMPFDYVQITPDSALVVKRTSGAAPAKFSDMPRYFQAGFDTYMDNAYLSAPEQALYLMSRMAADFPLIIDHGRLHFMNASETLQPENPFVAVGRFALADGVQAPVRFDKGHVKIVAPNGESYFDVSQLPKVTVAEIIKAPAAYGLWIIPSETSSQVITERLELSEDDVAFIDSHGVIKTLDSSEPSIAQVYYPDVEEWFDVLGKYRFWLMVLLWFLLTMVVVYLYRMSRNNKLAREEDDLQYQSDEDLMQGSAAANMHEDHTLHPGDTLDHLDERR